MKYRDLNGYLQERFGKKIYKLALDAGTTCPNRDGACGDRGCIFCSASGSGDYATRVTVENIEEQFCVAKALVEKKVYGKTGEQKAVGYIPYFQANTNTYGDASSLEPLFQKAIELENVVAISIATRPDCLPDEILDMLSRLNRQKPVWVELGLQTMHESTATYIRRGYTLDVYDAGVEKLRERGLEVIVHVILGLPGEDRKQMIETVEYVGNSGVQGIKLQLLHVLRGTDLAREYEKTPFPIFTLEEYVDVLKECVGHLPKDMVIHRLTGDGPRDLLVEPTWSANKRMVMNTIRKEFANYPINQGEFLVEMPHSYIE